MPNTKSQRQKSPSIAPKVSATQQETKPMKNATVIHMPPMVPPKPPALDPNAPCNAALIYGENDIPFARKQEIITLLHRVSQQPQTINQARTQANQRLAELSQLCNFRIWGHGSATSEPTPEQLSELRERAAQTDHKEYRQNAREVAALTYLLEGLAGAEEAASRAHTEKWAAQAKAEEDARLLAEFEAHEAALKERRFETWKMSRSA
jgi:hypothetical protein